MQNNKQTQSLVTLCDVDRYIQQELYPVFGYVKNLSWIFCRCCREDENRTHTATIMDTCVRSFALL